MSDVYSKKKMLFWGMLLQGLAILLIPYSESFIMLVSISAILGLGTALVYPTFLSTIAEATNPNQRAESIGTFRLWRDMGYAFGAIISGITADLFGVHYAILLIGALTVLSSLIIKVRMPDVIKEVSECIEPEAVMNALKEHRKVKIIDVRSKEEFEQSHIPSAVNISLSELKSEIRRIDKSYQIVTVCTKGGGRSASGAGLLNKMGYNATWLCGGTDKWLSLQ
jgi:rhodanese-related sulfurtransferase